MLPRMHTPPEDTRKSLLIVGAGPAGLVAAIHAAGAGARVSVLERMEQPGRKLLVTGGGRCNLTQDIPTDRLAKGFGPAVRFVGPALGLLGPDRLRTWLGKLGVPTAVEPGGGVYPASRKASDVLNALLAETKRLGVRILADVEVRALDLCAGAVAGLRTSAGPMPADGVILAAGGRSWPKLGSSGLGYQLARQAGLAVTKPVPALAGLLTDWPLPRRLPGVTLTGAAVTVVDGKKRLGRHLGDVLFTHRGLSGPAVLDASGDAATVLATGRPVHLRLVTCPDTGEAQWREQFAAWQSRPPRKTIRSMLSQRMPAGLASALLETVGAGPQVRAAELSVARANRLAVLLGGLSLRVTATEGWDQAMVTRGGVDRSQVDQRTMAAREVQGLWLAGEVLDVDGPCGGWNLTWAFASGALAGTCAASQAPQNLRTNGPAHA